MAAATSIRSNSDLSNGAEFGRTGSSQFAPLARPDLTFGVLIFIGSEVMLFAGLLSAFFVVRASAPFWPPPNQPRFPVIVTAFNTGLLIASAVTMWQVLHLLRRHNQAKAVRWTAATTALGALFLVIQGSEWVRLMRFGLTMTSSLYGSLFYLIVGAHALHLAVAVCVV